MKKNMWSDDERAEFDLLVTEALAVSKTSARVDVFLNGLDDAVQAHRVWARDFLTDIRRRGAESLLKSEMELRRPRVAVVHDGTVIGKAPREFGYIDRNEEGKSAHHRSLFDFLTWDELRVKREEFVRTRRAAEVDTFTVDKLLTLQDKAPSAATPDEACRLLGITVEEFLADEGAA